MAKCECGQEAEFAWQPFGPEPNCRDKGAFTALGSHYRGFPVVKVCWDCKGRAQNGETVLFTYKKQVYHLIGELAPMTGPEYRAWAKAHYTAPLPVAKPADDLTHIERDLLDALNKHPLDGWLVTYVRDDAREALNSLQRFGLVARSSTNGDWVITEAGRDRCNVNSIPGKD